MSNLTLAPWENIGHVRVPLNINIFKKMFGDVICIPKMAQNGMMGRNNFNVLLFEDYLSDGAFLTHETKAS